MKPSSIDLIMASSRFSQRPAPQNKPAVCKKSQRQAPQPDPVNNWPIIEGYIVRAYAIFESVLIDPLESWDGVVLLTPMTPGIWEGRIDHSLSSYTRVRLLYDPSIPVWGGEAVYRAESGRELFVFLGPPPEEPAKPFLIVTPFKNSISDPGQIQVTFAL